MRMKGFNVLFPMGFDAFGLPAENAAVQRNVHPAIWTAANVKRMQGQLRSMGCMFDWEREINSSDPSYYRWSQWFFQEFLKGGKAYRGSAVLNWSPSLQTVLANEQVIDGLDERNGQPVEQRLMEQWFFSITDYADELLSYRGIDWPSSIEAVQRNWIGRSEGAEVVFKTESGDAIEVFTTRPDTLWGATFMVLAPEHDLVGYVTTAAHADEVEAYIEATKGRSELERMENEEKTGVFTGGFAINPVNDAKVPIWIADYVLMGYGTGAIMAVPAHDRRDFEFARAFDLDVVPVITPPGGLVTGEKMKEAYVGSGTMVNSGPLDGTPVTDDKGRKNPSVAAAIDFIEAAGTGAEAINFRLRDWVISRQRYWGGPIPMLYRQDGSVDLVPAETLPVVLPEDVDFLPSGRSPLTYNKEFLATVDVEGEPARRETDTLDTFMCSSWYQYRYLSPGLEDAPFDPEEASYWLPVDDYTGGAEHGTMHLLYTRFFTKAMRDLGMFDETKAIMEDHGRDTEGLFDEPMLRLKNQGQILGAERVGEILSIKGAPDGSIFKAESVRVVEPTDLGDDDIRGELMGRTENILRVAYDDLIVTVEVPESAVVEIPAIPGTNDVSQLKHHLEVERMSKSRGNVVNPDELVESYGADVVRTHLMFAFDWTKGGPWDPSSINGSQRFIDDIWKLAGVEYRSSGEGADRALLRQVHQTIAKVGHDMDEFSFNTAVAALMTLRNEMAVVLRDGSVSSPVWQIANETMLLLLAPIAPHVTEELWSLAGHQESIHLATYPVSDPKLAADDEISLIVQVNGKVRDKITVSASISSDEAEAVALGSEKVEDWVKGKTIRKVIVVPGRLVNIVVG
jgi:leucyl-tRNA synthetase